MNVLGIVDAVLTDDSDVLVFGAKRVFRKYVPHFCPRPEYHR